MRTFLSLRQLAYGTTAACVLGLAGAATASAQDAGRSALDRFDRVDDAAWSAERDVPVFLSGELRAASSAQPEAIAEAFLDEQTALLRVAGPVDFAITRVKHDDSGSNHVRVMQEVSGVPVFGAESVVHIGRQGQVYAFGGDVHPGAASVDTKAALSAQAALSVAKSWLPAGTVLTIDAVQMPEDGPMAESTALAPTSRLVIYPEADGAYRLAYVASLQVAAPDPAFWQVFVDAKTGEVFHSFNAIHTAAGHAGGADVDFTVAEAVDLAAPLAPMPAASAAAVQASTGSGSSLYSGTVSIDTYLSSGTYYIYDVTRTNSYIRTMDGNNGSSLPGSYITETDNNFTSSRQRAAVDAHWGAAKTYDYYKNTHGRNSYNGAGAAITSTVHHQSNYNNAFWNNSQMVYGDGDGSTFTPLVELDICTHELTHAVTSSEANLIYQNESGALNEAVSDIFAVMVDRDDWTVGERSYTPGTSGDALRSLSNPPSGDQPDNYADRYTGTGDNGGVHINSGIFNKAAYLMAQGGTFRGVTVASIGRAKTEKVWYRALTTYFTQSTGYTAARAGVLQATADLYGGTSSADYAAVQNAFAAVGIGSASGGGGGGTPPPSGGTPSWRYETITKNTPHPYANNWNNTYTYTKTGAQRIALYFQQFELESNYDYVYIKDSGNTTRATYTGTKSAFWAIVDGGQIKVNTVTDASVTGYGWRITRAAYFSDRNLLVADPNPELGFEPQAEMSDLVGIGSKTLPTAFALTGLFPNPTAGQATVAYALPQTSDVTLAAYDVLGRRVALLQSGQVEAGTHEASFDASALPAGLYVVQLRAGDQVLTERLTVAR